MGEFLAKTSAVLVLLGALTSSSAVNSVPVAENGPHEGGDHGVCLQNNRIWSWNVIDDHTVAVGDVTNHRFLVTLSGGCIGLTTAILELRFKSWLNLGCLQRGDEVAYSA